MKKKFLEFTQEYSSRLSEALKEIPVDKVEKLAVALNSCWKNKNNVFIFGNGGSAANAMHLANDFIYGISKEFGHALKINALPSNAAVLTCLANDEGYENIYVRQLAVLAEKGDVVIALSGSGNSPNILNALDWCQKNDIDSFAILGFSGGKALDLAGTAIHIPVNDMQISEDLQLVIGHMLMRWLLINS